MRRLRVRHLGDVVAVLVFVVIGRASHHHGETVAGIASTAWPFLVGLVAGWLASARLIGRQAWAAQTVVTVAVGMVVRVLAGQGTAVAFVVVALVVLGGAFALVRLLCGRRLLSSRS